MRREAGIHEEGEVIMIGFVTYVCCCFNGKRSVQGLKVMQVVEMEEEFIVKRRKIE